MSLEFQDIKFSFDGKGGQTGTQTANFSATVKSAHAVLMGFNQKFDNGGESAETGKVAITDVSLAAQAVNVTAILDIQPSNDKNMTGWITVLVIADV